VQAGGVVGLEGPAGLAGGVEDLDGAGTFEDEIAPVADAGRILGREGGITIRLEQP
jgi:hypothetical protein